MGKDQQNLENKELKLLKGNEEMDNRKKIKIKNQYPYMHQKNTIATIGKRRIQIHDLSIFSSDVGK
jgi:hypothetical protein